MSQFKGESKNEIISTMKVNFNNYDENEVNYWYLLENKFVQWTLNVFTFGVYPFYVWTSRHNQTEKHKVTEQEEIKKNIDESIRRKDFIEKNHSFFQHYSKYINNVSGSNQIKQKKDNKFNLIYIFGNVGLCIVTGGLYGLWLIYNKWENIKFHNELNVFLKFLKEKEQLKQLGQEQKRYKKEFFRNQSLNYLLQKNEEFNYESMLVDSISSDKGHKTTKKYDPFLRFLFWSSYVFLVLITGGIFGIYHAIQKFWYKKEFDFFNEFLKNQVIDKDDFNERVGSLIENKEEEFDYESALTSSFNGHYFYFDYSSLYQSIFFKKKSSRFWTIFVLSFFSGGLFAVYIFFKISFLKKENYLSFYERKQFSPIDMNSDMWYIQKMSIKAMQLTRLKEDINLLIVLNASKINYLSSKVDLTPAPCDFKILFVKTVASHGFKLIFTFIWTLLSLALIVAWWWFFELAVNCFLFPITLTVLIIFTLLNAYHIFLAA